MTKCPRCHNLLPSAPRGSASVRPHCAHCEANARRIRDEEERVRRNLDNSFSAPMPSSLDPFQTSTFDTPSYDPPSYDPPSTPDTDFGGGGGFSGGGSSDTF
jgi:hypothetical protein